VYPATGHARQLTFGNDSGQACGKGKSRWPDITFAQVDREAVNRA
jgi:hypothetical protein